MSADGITLCYFATHMAPTVSHDTITMFLAAVRDFHLQHVFTCNLQDFCRQYIFFDHFHISGLLQLDTARDLDNQMIWAIICSAQLDTIAHLISRISLYSFLWAIAGRNLWAKVQTLHITKTRNSTSITYTDTNQ